MSIPSVSGLARQHQASFKGDSYVPRSWSFDDSGKALMGSISLANQALETKAMQAGFDLTKQESYNDTLLAIEKMRTDQRRKESILGQLKSNMAGSSLSTFLAGGGSLSNQMVNKAVDAAASKTFADKSIPDKLIPSRTIETKAQQLAATASTAEVTKLVEEYFLGY
jgi:hypothetical protein